MMKIEPITHNPLPITNKKGVTVIVIVFTMMIFSILGLVLASLQSVDFESATRYMQSERAFNLAEAGIEHGLHKLANDIASWPADTLETYTVDHGQYTIVYQNLGSETLLLTATGYVPSVGDYMAKYVVQNTVTSIDAIWEKGVKAGGGSLFDWSEMIASSTIRSHIAATDYDRDNDANYNELNTDYGTNLPRPLNFDRLISTSSIPSLNLAYYKGKAQAENQYFDNTYVYIADFRDGLQVINNTDPINPVQDGRIDTSRAFGVHGYFYDEGIDAFFTCIADNNSIKFINLTDPLNPVIEESYAGDITKAYGVFVKVKGDYTADYVYVADGGAGLRVLDISDLTDISETDSVTLGDTAYNVYVRGDYAYVADSRSGLQIVDVSDPGDISVVGNYSQGSGRAQDVYVRGRYAYIAYRARGLIIVDVSDPNNPVFRARYNTPGSAYGVYVRGNYAYVADKTSGLQIIDVSNLNNSYFSPTLTGSLATTNAYDVHVSGYFAYVADGADGLKVINISNPALPSLAGSLACTDRADGVYVLGDKTFDGDNNNQKIWYITGNVYIDVLSGRSRFLGTSLVSEGDVDIVGDEEIEMQAHVDAGNEENYPNIALKEGSIFSTDLPKGNNDNKKRGRRNFDALLYSEKGCIDFYYIDGNSLMAKDIYLEGKCRIRYNEKYLGDSPSGMESGISVEKWE